MFTQAQLIVLFSCNMCTNCHLATAAYDHISCVEVEQTKENQITVNSRTLVNVLVLF